jgi:hypothetical protein
MPATVLFHTKDLWTRHRILWSGHYAGSGVHLFNDAFSANIAGRHASALSGYGSFGESVSVTRLDTTAGNLAIAGSSPSGIPYTIAGPPAPVDVREGAQMANYLTEFGTALGSVYIETSNQSVVSGGGFGVFAGDIWWHPTYPPASGNWFSVSGIGYAQNDVIGLDYPDNPRILISTPEESNLASGVGSPGIMVINVASGAGQEIRYQSLFSETVAKNMNVTDLEAHRILG